MNNVCPSCGKLYQIGPQHIGRRVTCKGCHSRLVVESSGLAIDPGISGVPNAVPQPPLNPLSVPPPPLPPFDISEDDTPPRRWQRPPGSSGNWLVDFLRFRVMLTPFLIEIFFWVGIVISLVIGFRLIVTSFNSTTVEYTYSDLRPDSTGPMLKKSTRESSFSIVQFTYGVLVLVFGPLFIRLICEEAIIFFKIHSELKQQTDLARRNRHRP